MTYLCHMSTAFMAQRPANSMKNLSAARASQSEAAFHAFFSKKNKMKFILYRSFLINVPKSS